MAKLSAAQIAGHARAAGWTGEDLVTAVAVAIAESGGRTDARGDVTLQTGTWGPSIGLWQIRSLKAQRGSGGQRDEVANLDPGTNARHARQIWQAAGPGWKPWTVYKTGAYRLHVPAARAATAAGGGGGGGMGPVADTGGGGGGDSLTWQLPGVGRVEIPLPFAAAADGAQAAANAAEVAKNGLVMMVKAARWIGDPTNTMRVQKVILGTGLILAGLYVVVRPVVEPVVMPVVKTVVGVGRKAATRGAL